MAIRVYFKDMDYEKNLVCMTPEKQDAAHFAYEDQSSISAVDVIVSLLNRVHKFIWLSEIDRDDEDQRHIIYSVQ